MKTSQAIGQIAAALSAAQGAMKPAAFNRINPHFKNRYADLTSVIDAARAALAANGLAVAQSVTSDDLRVTVETLLSHKSGEWIEAVTTMKASKPDAQGIGGTFTYAKRYALCAMLGISADEDDDGNGAVAGGPPQREVGPKLEPKPEPSAPDPRRAFADSIRQWSGVNAEDLKAACGDAFKTLGVDPKTVADWPALNQRLADAREVFGTFGEWIASKE